MWREVVNFLVSLIVGYAINIVSSDSGFRNWIADLIILSGLITVVVLNVTRKKITEVGHYNQIVLRSTEEEYENARQGLVVVAPLYPTPGKIEEKKKYVLLAKQGDYSWMDFENSNFAHVIKAVKINQEKVRHCWIMSTASSEDLLGSDVFVPALINYLQNKEKVHCEFHLCNSVEIKDDSSVTEKTRRAIERIFIEARHLGLDDSQVIVDCTGGPRSMTLGIFLACLDGKTDIQFIGSKYNENGKAEGPTIPMVTNFSVKTIEKD